MAEFALDQISLFAPLAAEERAELAASLQQVNLAAGALLFAEGEAGDRFYAIVVGQLEVVKALGTEDERLLHVQGPGTFLGEISLLEPAGLRTATVRARTAATLLMMTRADFQALLQRRPALAVEVLRVISLRLREADTVAIHDLHAKNAELARAYEELKAAQTQLIEKERMEHEMKLAHDLQQSIFPPEMPALAGFDFAAMMIPARGVGGDFYDFIPLSHDNLGIVVADVSDKGMPAAIFMALTHSLVRAEASRGLLPGEVLRRVNRHLLEMNQAGMFVTVLYGILRGKTGQFLYARAGHELPILLDGSGQTVATPRMQGQLLGLFPEPELDEQMIIVPRGGRLLLITDGVTDATNPTGEQFGQQRLIEAAQRVAATSAHTVSADVQAAVAAFQGDAAQFDDITLVVVQARESTPQGGALLASV